ncbi:MAG: DUF4328 domain-containing protein [Pseudonocardiaceae bacterium]
MIQQQPPAHGSAFERSGMLASAIVAVAVGWAVLHWLLVLAAPSAVRAYQDGLASRTPAAEVITTYDFLGVPVALVSIAAFILTGIWLGRARRNADRIAPEKQRRSAPWVWLGWLVPIVFFWFPKQVVDDVWRATVRDPGQPSTGWWWGSWIAAQLLGALATQSFMINGEPRPELLEYLVLFEGLTALATTLAALHWIRVVRIVSQAQDTLVDTVPPAPWEQLGPSGEYGYPS